MSPREQRILRRERNQEMFKLLHWNDGWIDLFRCKETRLFLVVAYSSVYPSRGTLPPPSSHACSFEQNGHRGHFFFRSGQGQSVNHALLNVDTIRLIWQFLSWFLGKRNALLCKKQCLILNWKHGMEVLILIGIGFILQINGGKLFLIS